MFESVFVFFDKYPLLLSVIQAILIVIGFLVLKKLFIGQIFRFFRFLSSKTRTTLDNKIVEAFEKPLSFLFICLGFFLATVVIPFPNEVSTVFFLIFRSVVIMSISWGLYNLASETFLLEAFTRKFELDRILVPFFSKITRFVVVALAFTIIIQEWGYNIQGFIAGLGLGGLAFALAAKDTVSNIFAGIVVIVDKPFSIGDWIKTSNVEGTVEDITFRSTRIRTFDQALITIPNATLVNDAIINWSKMGKRRITFKLGVTYSTPKDKLEKCIKRIEKMLQEHPDVHKDTIFVKFDGFNSSSLDIFLYFFSNTTVWEEFLGVKEDVNFKIMDILKEEGVSCAFPSTSVYFENEIPNKSK